MNKFITLKNTKTKRKIAIDVTNIEQVHELEFSTDKCLVVAGGKAYEVYSTFDEVISKIRMTGGKVYT